MQSYMPKSPFGGECSQNEIDRLKKLADSADCMAVLGIGGGKTLIPPKRWHILWTCRSLLAPTIASTDAPCSAPFCDLYRQRRIRTLSDVAA